MWLKFCSNRTIIYLAIGQKLSKAADWTIKSKMAAKEIFVGGKTLHQSRNFIKIDIWLKFHQNPWSGLGEPQVCPNMQHLWKCPPTRLSNFFLLKNCLQQLRVFCKNLDEF